MGPVKKLHVLCLTAAATTMLLGTMALDCGGGEGEGCRHDDECSPGDHCLSIFDNSACRRDLAVNECSCVAGEAVDEGGDEGGDGGGVEGEPFSACADDDLALGVGNGLIIDEVDLDPSTNASCAIAGTSDFDFVIFTAGQGQPASWDGTVDDASWVAFATTSTVDAAAFAATSCNGGAVACIDENLGPCDGTTECACACVLCLSAAPADLAARMTDALGDTSDGTCVAIDGA